MVLYELCIGFIFCRKHFITCIYYRYIISIFSIFSIYVTMWFILKFVYWWYCIAKRKITSLLCCIQCILKNVQLLEVFVILYVYYYYSLYTIQFFVVKHDLYSLAKNTSGRLQYVEIANHAIMYIVTTINNSLGITITYVVCWRKKNIFTWYLVSCFRTNIFFTQIKRKYCSL